MTGHSKLVKDPSALTADDLAALQELDRKCLSRQLPGIGPNVRALLERIKLASEGRDDPRTRGPGYPITVDYTLEREPAIEAGRFDWVDQEHRFDVTLSGFYFSLYNHPKGEKKEDTTVHLIHLDLPVNRDGAAWMLKRRGFRAIALRELLALAAKYPDLQREYPIMALESCYNRDGIVHTSFLGKDKQGGRVLDQRDDYRMHFIHPCFRFAARRIEP